MEELEPKGNDAILTLARKRFQLSFDADKEDRVAGKDDLRFLNGEQWDAHIKAEREANDRPCLTINKMPTFQDQIIGDQRQNKPKITVLPVDSESDPETAKVIGGIIRNIENISDAEVAYDTGFEYSSGCGRGFFRIITEFSDWDSFQQNIKIKRIANPFTVYLGPHNEIDGSDAPYGFITEEISREEYKAQFPGKTPHEMEAGDEDMSPWGDESTITIAEYFWKEHETIEIYLLEDGTTTTEKPESFEKSRKSKRWKIKWAKIDGYQFLTETKDWPGKYIPVIPIWGKELNIDGKRYTRGAIRHAKDAQRLYNYFRSTDAETVALQPRAPYLVTPKMISGFQSMWKNAHKKNMPYLLFNPDPAMQGGRPMREMPPQASSGNVEQIHIASDDMKSTIGIYDASLGARSNETSGKAIIARQREGDIGSFAFIDNLSRSIRHAGRVLVDLIPYIYDTAMVARIRNEDETEKFVQINQAFVDEKGEDQLYDVTVGKYDVVVKTGPSYSTQRQEAADSMMKFIEVIPNAAPIISDLVAKNMDWPGAQEIGDRLKKILPPGIAETEEGEQPAMPAEPPPPPPDPVLEIKLAIEQEKLKQEQAQTAQYEIALSKARVELEAAAAPAIPAIAA